MNKNEEIRQKVIEAFKASGMNYVELAKLANVSERIVSYWIKGERVPSDIATADKILKALHVSVVLGRE